MRHHAAPLDHELDAPPAVGSVDALDQPQEGREDPASIGFVNEKLFFALHSLTLFAGESLGSPPCLEPTPLSRGYHTNVQAQARPL